MIGEWGTNNGYAGISMNGSMTNYNVLSSPSDQNLFLNRPTGWTIKFRENNSTQMMVNTGGNVGIGSGDNGTPARLYILGNSTTTAPTFMTQNSTKTNFGLAVLDNGNVGIGTTAAGGSLIVNSGNVGIGFTTPDRTLQIASDINITSSLSSLLGANGSQFAITGNSATGLQKKLTLGIDK